MIKFKIKAKLSSIQAKSPEYRKKVVKYVSSELLRKSSAYIPYRFGTLERAGLTYSVPEQGRLIWKTPYARKQWKHGKSKGLRGRLWAKRAWLDNRNYILSNAKSIV